MYNKPVFIVFPWPSANYSGVALGSCQIRSAYDIVMKAMAYKMYYEKNKKIKPEIEMEKYNLKSFKVFFSFRDELLANLAEPQARDYLTDCLVAIRESDFSKQSVRDSFDILRKYLANENYSNIIKNALVDEKSFMNFPAIFTYAQENTIDEDCIIMTKIKNVINAYKDRVIKE